LFFDGEPLLSMPLPEKRIIGKCCHDLDLLNDFENVIGVMWT